MMNVAIRLKLFEMPLAVLTAGILTALVVCFNEGNFRPTTVADGGTDFQTLAKFGLCGLLGIFSLFQIWHMNWANRSPFCLLILAYCLIAFLCCATAVKTTFSIACCVTLTCVVVFAFSSLRILGRKNIILVCLFCSILFLMGCIATHWIAPEINGFDAQTSNEASEGRLGGLSHPNTTGRIAAFAVALSLTLLPWNTLPKWFAIALAVFSFLCLIATGSRTWLIASMASILLFVWYQRPISTSIPLALGMAVLVSGILTVAVSTLRMTQFDQGLAIASRSGKSSEYYSMTGRVPLWQYCSKRFLESPLVGHGHGCQRFVIADHYWKTQHAHNIFLNSSLGTGIIGVILLVTIFLRQCFLAIVSPGYFPDAMLLLILIGGMTENPILNPIPGMSTMLFVWSLLWRENLPMTASLVETHFLTGEAER